MTTKQKYFQFIRYMHISSQPFNLYPNKMTAHTNNKNKRNQQKKQKPIKSNGKSGCQSEVSGVRGVRKCFMKMLDVSQF